MSISTSVSSHPLILSITMVSLDDDAQAMTCFQGSVRAEIPGTANGLNVALFEDVAHDAQVTGSEDELKVN